MPSVTADTNIYVSGLNFGGRARQFLNLAEAGLIQLAVSEDILAEIVRVLSYPKIGWPQARIAQAQRQIRRYAQIVTPVQSLTVIAVDPSDNRIVECAMAAKSEYIVTGDSHLLALRQYRDIQIVKLADFLDRLPRTQTAET